MKTKRLLLIFSILAAGVFLSACTNAGAINSWSNALITDTSVYYTSGPMVYALRVENGNVAWSYPEKTSAKRLFYATPVLIGEQLIVGDYENKLTSLNITDGHENWQFTEAKGGYIDSPLIVNETIIAPNADFNVYALTLDGAEKWVFNGDHAFWAQPATDGKNVFVPSMDHFLYALDINNGSLKWKVDLYASLVSRPMIAEDGTIYQGNLDGSVFAINSVNGKIIWDQKVNGGVWAAPVVYDGKLYFGDQTGNINILNIENGNIVQSIQTDGAVLGSGALLTDGIAFGNENGELIMLGFNGEKKWTRSFDGKIFANLVLSGDRLLVIATGGEKPLIALDTNGNENWYFSEKK